MKKAFDANVSRAKPRVRLGALMGASADGSGAVAHDSTLTLESVEAIAQQVAQSEDHPDLTSALRSRQVARSTRVSASEALQNALEAEGVVPVMTATPPPVVAHAEAPLTVTEVQAPPRPSHEAYEVEFEAPPSKASASAGPEAGERREKLRERLRAVRANPRPEPLPETVAEAGVLAVERISALQTELSKARAMNLALTQDLEATRRQAERATEEARLRMDEARRLSSEMEGRVKLLSDLERELEALESERNEALLALQESRQAIDAGANEKTELKAELLKRDSELNESLAEEERLATELEEAQESMAALRRATDALKGERDILARQVSDLTRERADLLEARKALEAVHRALSQAAMKS